MALQNSNVTVDIVESNEFPEISGRYGIRGVPTTVIDETTQVVGAVPMAHFLQEITQHLVERQKGQG
ncbi:MAG: thioredoxin family protein [Chloroflexi bacterium]|nr:thioredoxin family protein [Chloroflexota bacterium]